MRSHLVLTPREYEASRAGHFHARRLAFVLDAAATVPADVDDAKGGAGRPRSSRPGCGSESRS